MKRNDTRGMRDIPTIQGLRHRSLPTTREQTVAAIARLEHEKARLQREVTVWNRNRKRTEGQLQGVEERLALLQQALDPPDPTGAPRRTQAPRPTAGEAGDGDGDDGGARRWREITVEY
ncbi:MAG: hypothetical protein ISS56_15310 [Anaerolineae bacterium]|nr:hypothetical protein [Anaerolineae bacterium]